MLGIIKKKQTVVAKLGQASHHHTTRLYSTNKEFGGLRNNLKSYGRYEAKVLESFKEDKPYNQLPAYLKDHLESGAGTKYLSQTRNQVIPGVTYLPKTTKLITLNLKQLDVEEKISKKGQFHTDELKKSGKFTEVDKEGMPSRTFIVEKLTQTKAYENLLKKIKRRKHKAKWTWLERMENFKTMDEIPSEIKGEFISIRRLPKESQYMLFNMFISEEVLRLNALIANDEFHKGRYINLTPNQLKNKIKQSKKDIVVNQNLLDYDKYDHRQMYQWAAKRSALKVELEKVGEDSDKGKKIQEQIEEINYNIRIWRRNISKHGKEKIELENVDLKSITRKDAKKLFEEGKINKRTMNFIRNVVYSFDEEALGQLEHYRFLLKNANEPILKKKLALYYEAAETSMDRDYFLSMDKSVRPERFLKRINAKFDRYYKIVEKDLEKYYRALVAKHFKNDTDSIITYKDMNNILKKIKFAVERVEKERENAQLEDTQHGLTFEKLVRAYAKVLTLHAKYTEMKTRYVAQTTTDSYRTMDDKIKTILNELYDMNSINPLEVLEAKPGLKRMILEVQDVYNNEREYRLQNATDLYELNIMSGMSVGEADIEHRIFLKNIDQVSEYSRGKYRKFIKKIDVARKFKGNRYWKEHAKHLNIDPSVLSSNDEGLEALSQVPQDADLKTKYSVFVLRKYLTLNRSLEKLPKIPHALTSAMTKLEESVSKHGFLARESLDVFEKVLEITNTSIFPPNINSPHYHFDATLPPHRIYISEVYDHIHRGGKQIAGSSGRARKVKLSVNLDDLRYSLSDKAFIYVKEVASEFIRKGKLELVSDIFKDVRSNQSYVESLCRELLSRAVQYGDIIEYPEKEVPAFEKFATLEAIEASEEGADKNFETWRELTRQGRIVSTDQTFDLSVQEDEEDAAEEKTTMDDYGYIGEEWEEEEEEEEEEEQYYNTIIVGEGEKTRKGKGTKKKKNNKNQNEKKRRKSKFIVGIQMLHKPPTTMTAEKELRFKNKSKTTTGTMKRKNSYYKRPKTATKTKTPESPSVKSIYKQQEEEENELDALVSLHPKQSMYQSKHKQSLFMHQKLEKFQLSIMPFFLVFSKPEVEKEFVNFYYGRNLFRFRATTIILLICYAIFGVFWDLSQEALYFETHIVITVFSIFCAFLIAIPIHVNYLLTKYKRIAVAELTIFAFIGIILTASLFKSLFAIIYDSFYYPIGSAITIAICFTLPHPRIYVLYIVSILYMLLYVVIMIGFIYGGFIPYQHRYLLYLLVLVVSLVPSLIVNFFMEYQVRVNFKLSKEIKYEKNFQLKMKHHSDKLLRNVLPKPLVAIARENMVNGRLAQPYYRRKSNISVLLMDIINFTEFCARTPSAEIIFLLNKYFCSFDRYMQQLKLEKVKTIGDAYLAVGGLFENYSNKEATSPARHLANILILGQYMLEEIQKFNASFKWDHSVRIGISFGNIIYAMFGKQTISFDIFGEALNETFKLEAMATPNTIHISKKAFNMIANVLDPFIHLEDKIGDAYTIEYNSHMITTLQNSGPLANMSADPSFSDLSRMETQRMTFAELQRNDQNAKNNNTFVMEQKNNSYESNFTKDVESYLKPKTKTYLIPLLLCFKTFHQELEYYKHGWAKSFWYNSILYHFSLLFYSLFIFTNVSVLFTEQLGNPFFIMMYVALGINLVCFLLSIIPITKLFYIGSALVFVNHLACQCILMPLFYVDGVRELASFPLSIYFIFFFHIPLSFPYFIKFLVGLLPITGMVSLSIHQKTFSWTALGFLLGIHFLLTLSYYYIDLLNRYGYLLKRELDRDGIEIEKEYIRTHSLIRASMPRDILILLRKSEFQPLKIQSSVTNCAVAFIKVDNLVNLLPSKTVDIYNVLNILNRIFIEFDEQLREFECTRIKTVGSSYMVVCGCPSSISEPAAKLVRYALQCQEVLFLPGLPTDVRITTGIHFGNISAGVIGHTKFLYDVVGDVPNLASRLQTTSKAGGIQVSEEVVKELHNTSNYSFSFERRGSIPIKGKGMTNTYYITNCMNIENK